MKPVTDQAPRLYTKNPTSQILHKIAAKTLTIMKPIMDQAPKVLHITQLAKFYKKSQQKPIMGQAPKFQTHNPTSQTLTKSTAKTLITLNPIMSQAPKFHTHNPSSQILPKSTAKTLIPLNPIIDQAPKFHTHNSIKEFTTAHGKAYNK